MPDLADRGSDAGFDIDEHVWAPQPLDDRVARDQLTPVLHEQDEKVHRLPLQPDWEPVTTELICGNVQLEIQEAIGKG